MVRGLGPKPVFLQDTLQKAHWTLSYGCHLATLDFLCAWVSRQDKELTSCLFGPLWYNLSWVGFSRDDRSGFWSIKWLLKTERYEKRRKAGLCIGRSWTMMYILPSWTVMYILPSHGQLVGSFGASIACQSGPASDGHSWCFTPLSLLVTIYWLPQENTENWQLGMSVDCTSQSGQKFLSWKEI